MGFLTFVVSVSGLSIVVSPYALGLRLGTIADAIRERR